MELSISPFNKKGSWFKGNTHTHTNAFDGFSPVEDVVKLYKDANYNFLTITDHNMFRTYPEFNDENFIMLNATELTYGVQIDDKELLKEMNEKVSSGNMSQEEMLKTIQTSFTPKNLDPTKVPHLIAIARNPEKSSWNEDIDSTNFQDIQVMIDLANKNDCLSIIAHPSWSKLNIMDLKDLKDYTAIEVYNHVCEKYFAGGISSAIWDQLLSEKNKVNAIACDDTHDISISLGGYIMVKSEKFDYLSIIKAIEDGDYYSSTGPTINDVVVYDKTIKVSCSNAKKIRFITDTPLGRTYEDETCSMTECTHKLNELEKYVRIEVIDKNENIAWTNPIYFN